MLKLRSTDGHELSSLGLVMLLLRLSHLLVVLEILIVCGILVLLSQLLHMISWEGIPKPLDRCGHLSTIPKCSFKSARIGPSLEIQWLKLCLPMQEARVQSQMPCGVAQFFFFKW